jgi:transcriptional regulator with XRE-family HTH domain
VGVTGIYSTTREWEQMVGRQIRAARISNELDQTSLAALANVSVGALSNLERGKGSSLTTVIAIVRALGRTDWLESLAPVVSVSPIQMLRSKRTAPPSRVRVRKSASASSQAR